MYVFNTILGGPAVQVNAVSVVNLITAVGLSVEFCAHIILKFTQVNGTRLERAKAAVAQMGSSVLVGITCTKLLGVIVLDFAPTPLFRMYYFRMYLSIVLLGSFHGLVFIPIVLSLIGPMHKRTVNFWKDFCLLTFLNRKRMLQFLKPASLEKKASRV